jgi:DNA invertase Pin-like site-specific DNA recombinase
MLYSGQSVRVDGYIRVSRVGARGGENFISPAEQRDRIAAWSKAQGVEVVQVHEDLDEVGSKFDRPGLTKMMERVKRGTVEGIVVAKLNRFGRSMLENAKLFAEIREADAALFTVVEGIDSRGPIGGMLAGLFSVLAEYELETIKENWSTARASAVKRGVHVSSKCPTGYVRDEDGRLEVDEKAGPAIAEVFRAKAKGASWGECAAILERAGIQTSYGGENWAQGSLRHLVANRVYLGEARSGEFVNAGAHQAIIDLETWTVAQTTRQPQQNGLGGALLSGLIRCAGCRYGLKADSMKNRQGEKVRLYRCRAHRSAGKCPAPASVLGSVVEPYVVEQFFDGLGDVLAEAVRSSSDLRELEERVERANAELVAYRDSAAVDVLGEDSFMAGLQTRSLALSEAQDALEAARDAAGTADLPDAASLRGIWPDLDVGDRRHLLHRGLDAVFVRSVGQANVPITDRALILWRGEGPDDLPGPGRKLEVRSLDWPS